MLGLYRLGVTLQGWISGEEAEMLHAGHKNHLPNSVMLATELAVALRDQGTRSGQGRSCTV